MMSLFSALTAKIFGGVAVAALLFAGIQSWRLSSALQDRDQARDALALEMARHAITRQSMDSLAKRLANMIKAGQFTQKNVEKAVSQAKQLSDALREQADDVRAVRGRDCRTPDEIRSSGL